MTTGTLSRSNRGRSESSSPLMDPRLRARRVEIERGRARQRLRRLVVLAVLILIGAATYGVTRTALLDVDHVEVTGVVGERAAAVSEAAAVARGVAMVDLDPAALDQRVSALPWVLDATVERQWPGTVAMAVIAREPVAVDVAGSAIDETGRSFGPSEPGTELPTVLGRPVAVGEDLPAELSAVLAVLVDLPTELVGDVASAGLVDGDVQLELVDGIDVRFGPSERHNAKFRALVALLDQADRSTIRSIDVRVPTSPSLTRRTGTGA